MTRLEFWNRYLRVYDAVDMIEAYGGYMNEVADRLCIRPGDVILDAGSGTGNLSVRMHKLGARVISLDFSPVALAIHRGKDPTATLVQASLESELQFGGSTFDAVACTSVLFTLSRAGVRTALREFRRILKPAGRLVATVEVDRRLPKLQFTLDQVLAPLRVQGVFTSLREVRRRLAPLLHLMYYNLLMHSLREQQGYRRFTKEELLGEIAEAGFSLTHYGTTYFGCMHLVEAVSPPSAEPAKSCWNRAKAPKFAALGPHGRASGQRDGAPE